MGLLQEGLLLMKFRYFEGPETEMHGLLEEPAECSFCGREDRCFEIQDSLEIGCLQCLREGRFGFFHVTEAGYIIEGKLIHSIDDELPETADPEDGVSPESVQELWRTPDFPTWNEVEWPVHCRDFMVFLGEWKPADFKQSAGTAASATAPRDLFLAMTDPSCHGLWPEDKDPEDWWVTCFAFRCPVCGELAAKVDYS
jgi:uncharacterized protein CbrC (UPF0167 family)